MNHKTRPLDIKAAGTSDGVEDGVFEAIVATYDLDSVGDKIVPGAFAKTLSAWKDSGSPIPVLWSHMSMDPDMHIGIVEEAEERPEGLWVKARLDLDGPKAAQVYKLLKGRRVNQFSFAYDVAAGDYVEKKNDAGDDESYFELRELTLYEVGPTLIGANQATELLDVKSRGRNIRVSVDAGGASDQRAVAQALKDAFGAVETVAPDSRPTAPMEDEAPSKAADDPSGQDVLAAAVESISAAVEDLRKLLAPPPEDDDQPDPSDDEKAKPAPSAPPSVPDEGATRGTSAKLSPAAICLRARLDETVQVDATLMD